ncbi:MAG: C-GCAxxG-C-C family protein [Bacteroidetes bacterium]|nr:C-GCAxxG-C-C family protein [Bacteroidota bacterium]
MTKSEEATQYFSETFNCSQSVFTPFGKEKGLSEDTCLRLATAFGGGMGRQQLTCGAVTGALMALGILDGRGKNDDASKKDETYGKTLEFFNEFKRKHGSVNCRELLQGLDMNNPEDQKEIERLKLFKTSCVEYVKDAVEIVERIHSRKLPAL